MPSTKEKLLEIYKAEYDKLKSEQLQRITFRDVQIPFSIFLGIAPILSVAFAKDNAFGLHLLLVIPLVCVALGWAYIANDEKITTIGDYVRDELKCRLSIVLKEIEPKEEINIILEELIFGWENFHKQDKYKEERKIFQLFVNLLLFVFSGIAALIIFLVLKGAPQTSAPVSTLSSFMRGWSTIPIPMKVLVISEAFFLITLGWWIYVYSGFKKNFRDLCIKWKRSFVKRR